MYDSSTASVTNLMIVTDLGEACFQFRNEPASTLTCDTTSADCITTLTVVNQRHSDPPPITRIQFNYTGSLLKQ